MLRRLAILVTLAAVAAPAARAATPQQRLNGTLSRIMRHAGSSAGALVVDAATGQTLFAKRSGTMLIPASVEKLYTTSTALARFGVAGTLTTTVLTSAPVGPDGTLAGDLYLRGGGDPTLGGRTFVRKYYGAGTTIEDIAARIVAAGVTSITGRVIGDETRFDALRGGPSSRFNASTDDEGALGALAYDRGLDPATGHFQGDQASFAAAKLAVALRHAGVTVRAGGLAGRTPDSARTLLRVASPPMATLIRMTNQPSDNFFAETLLKDLSASATGIGTTSGGAGVVLNRLETLLIRPQIVDGSGLSRFDRTSPAQVVTLLRSERHDGPFLSSLPIVGRSGTLHARMRGTAAAGRCLAKTGTLHDVSNLAGYCTAADGHQIMLAILMNHISPFYAQRLQDRMTVAIARYAG